MSFRLLPTAVRNMLEAADQVGAKLPAKVRADLDSRTTLIRNVGEMSVAGQSIADAVNTAVLNGNDPVNDADVLTAITRDRLAQIQNGGALVDAAQTQLLEITMTHLDAIYDAFKAPYDTAGGKLAEAHATITGAGIPTLDDYEIANANIEVAQANVHARTVTELMRRIANALDMLESATGRMGNGRGTARVSMTIDTGHATASELRGFGGALSQWDALTKGYTISLANPTEQRARVSRAQANDVAEDAGIERSRMDAIHSSYGKTPRQ